MQPETMRTSRVVALALVVGTFFVAQEALTDLALGRPLRLANDVEVVLRFWMVWALLTPLVLMAVRRWPLDAKPVYRPVIVHASVAAALASAQTAITLSLRPIARALSGTIGFREALRRMSAAARVHLGCVYRRVLLRRRRHGLRRGALPHDVRRRSG